MIPESGAEKKRPVIARNRKAIRGFSGIKTGDIRSLFSRARRLFDARRAVTRDDAHAIACASDRSRFPRVPPRVSSMRAFAEKHQHGVAKCSAQANEIATPKKSWNETRVTAADFHRMFLGVRRLRSAEQLFTRKPRITRSEDGAWASGLRRRLIYFHMRPRRCRATSCGAIMLRRNIEALPSFAVY
jgi:hypothetical protein